MMFATCLLWIFFGETAVIQNLQIDSTEFSKTKIVLTMSATRVDAIVRVVGLNTMPSTIVSAFKDLLLLSIKWRKSLNPCCQRYFLVMRLSLRDPETSLYQRLDYSSNPPMQQLNQ
ncbi:MAG: hypothetical protein B0W54_22340 [Cellvibrio sp. 79]|nr:MAG: hypothetical protein B0W54_22340 [Cellvibrio sp. 79]